MGGTATRSDRAAVLSAPCKINASLPWEHHILLGADIPERLAGEEIPVPEGEVHVDIIDGKVLREGLAKPGADFGSTSTMRRAWCVSSHVSPPHIAKTRRSVPRSAGP